MSSTIHTNTQGLNLTKESKSTDTKAPELFWEMMERNRFGIIPMVLTIVACISGFAAAKGIDHSVIQLIAVAIPAIFTLAMILAVAPMRAIVYSGIASLLINTIIFFI